MRLGPLPRMITDSLPGTGKSLVLLLVGGVEVGRVGLELGRAGVHRLVGGDDAVGHAARPHLQLGGPEEPADVLVAEAQPLRVPQFLSRQGGETALFSERLEVLLGLHDLAQLLQEPLVDEGGLEELASRVTPRR